MKNEFFNFAKIFAENNHYNFTLGNRSAGNLFVTLGCIVENWVKKGEVFNIFMGSTNVADEEFIQERCLKMFDEIVSAGVIEILTKGEWTNVLFENRCWFLCRYEGEKCIKQEHPFAYAIFKIFRY